MTPPRSEPHVAVEHATVAYTRGATRILALDDVDLAWARGERVAVLGPSGCGKSTLLGLLAGLAVPERGAIRVGADVVSAMGERARVRYRRRSVGFVPQQDNLLPFLTVAENVVLQLPADAADRPRGRVASLLSDLGLSGLGDRLPGQLSGGQRQRAAVARAVVGEPGLVLADEPTGSLDAVHADAVMDVLTGATEQIGATLVMVTHDPAIAGRVGSVVRLRGGRVDTEECAC